MNEDLKVDAQTLAEIIGVDVRRVQQLSKSNTIPTEKVKGEYVYYLPEAISAFIKYKTKSNALDKRKLKAEVEWKETKAKIVKLELDELEGRMHSSEDVEEVVTDLVLAIRSAIISLPGRVAFDVSAETDPAVCSGIIRRACNEILMELKNHKYDPEVYKQMVRKRQGYFDHGEEDDD